MVVVMPMPKKETHFNDGVVDVRWGLDGCLMRNRM
jgi:hypothetical protein